MSVLLARAQLFAAIEGGSVPWNEEISKLGPIEVRDRLSAGAYKTASKAGTIHSRTIHMTIHNLYFIINL